MRPPASPALRTVPRWVRACAVAVLLLLALSAGLMTAAARLYPGGTWFDRQAPGHHFWLNYVCDLTHGTALNGTPNPAAPFAQVALLGMIAALGPFWFLLTRLFPNRRRLGQVVRSAGVLAVVAAFAIPLTPSNVFGRLHGTVVLLAIGPALLAAVCGITGVWLDRRCPPVLRLVGTAALVAMALDVALYAHHMATGTPASVLIPIVQRIALILIVAFMVGVSVLSLRPAAVGADGRAP